MSRLEDRVVNLAVDAAVNGVDQAVALAAAGMNKERGGEDPLSARSENHVNGIVHAASHHRFDRTAFRRLAKDVSRAGPEGRSRSGVDLLGKCPFTPVDPTVQPRIRSVKVIGATRERLTFEPLDPLVGHSVAVGIGQLPDGGRARPHIQRAAQPHRSLRKHHLVGEDGALVEDSVPVAVLEPHDPVRLLLELLLDIVVRARRVRDVQPPLVVERGRDRPVNERRTGDPVDRESLRHFDRAAVDLGLAPSGFARTTRREHHEDDDMRKSPRTGKLPHERVPRC